MTFNNNKARIGLLNDNALEFSIEAEFENKNIVSAKGYFKNDYVYKVHWGTTQTLKDKITGIDFSIFISKEGFSFSQGYENVENLLVE